MFTAKQRFKIHILPYLFITFFGFSAIEQYFCIDKNTKINEKQIGNFTDEYFQETDNIINEDIKDWKEGSESITNDYIDNFKKYLSKGEKCINQILQCEPGFLCEEKKWKICLKSCNNYIDCNPSGCQDIKTCQKVEDLKFCIPQGCPIIPNSNELFIPSIEPICPMWGADILHNIFGSVENQKFQAAGWKKYENKIEILLGFECHNTKKNSTLQVVTNIIQIKIENNISESIFLIDGKKVKVYIVNYVSPLAVECPYHSKSVIGKININLIKEDYIEGEFDLEANMAIGGVCGEEYVGKLYYNNGWFKAKKLPSDLSDFPPAPYNGWWEK